MFPDTHTLALQLYQEKLNLTRKILGCAPPCSPLQQKNITNNNNNNQNNKTNHNTIDQKIEIRLIYFF